MESAVSNRAFGITIGTILMVASAILSFIEDTIFQPYILAAAIGIVLIFLACFLPNLLTWPNFLWTRFGNIAAKIVNPVLLFGIFLTVIVPFGLLMRILGKRPLNLKIDKNATSYWVSTNSELKQNSSMKDQY